MIDHLVYAVPDLALADDLGIALSPGGPHVGLGTRNLLASLGGDAYLEVIGPDPEQPEPDGPRPFGIDDLTEPKLVAWAVRVEDIDEAVERAKARGYDPGPVMSMSRVRPDGVLLEWRLTPPVAGILPFLIDWGSTLHPSASAAQGAVLESLLVTDYDKDAAYEGLKALGLRDFAMGYGPPGLMAEIRTSDGEVVLR
ncbi:hypothetical protein JOF56_005053 [Kibdelosporangium banguiense]|uniref:VOC domain-containing protein n=1 Tax=Kibdelosporangium banguiense TaxID=1365924 RepID=A0ABS4TL87_9PSEU|nr:VOC family protein [Kibdelosporangium banguiense]MBP2324668.1 hypothetical protein [Kibdelosporangium banguiense]